MTNTRPDIIAGLPEGKPRWQMASREILLVLKVWVELTLGQRALHIWGFTAKITDECILRLDILYAHNVVVDLKSHVL
jgi:hypothetical protein